MPFARALTSDPRLADKPDGFLFVNLRFSRSRKGGGGQNNATAGGGAASLLNGAPENQETPARGGLLRVSCYSYWQL